MYNSALNHLMYQNNHMQKYTSPVIIVEPEASIHDTLLQMQTNFIKRIVVASKNKPVGVVTERDISKFLEQDKTAKALDEIPIKYVMKKDPIVVQDVVYDNLETYTARMDTFNIVSEIVVNHILNFNGIVTKTDITKAYSKIY